MGFLKSFRFMSVMMVQTKCKLNNTELFLKLFHIQSNEIGNNKYYEETTELTNGKVRFRLNIDVRKEMEDSRLNAIKQLISIVKGRLNFSYKSTYMTFAVCLYVLRIFAFKYISQPPKTGRKTESCGNSLKLDLSE